MGKSTLIMLFLLAFGPNGESSSHKDGSPPPAAATERPAAEAPAPARLEAMRTKPSRALPSVPPQARLESDRDPEHPDKDKKNG